MPSYCIRAGLAAVAVNVLVGCGNQSLLSWPTAPLFVAECEGGEEPTYDLVLLDWTGGASPLYPGQFFPGLDPAAFPVSGVGTLADVDASFREQVQKQVERILCSSPGPKAVVRNAADADDQNPGLVSIVRFTQSISPQGTRRIGEGHYDICNRDHNNESLIFGEEIRLLAGSYTLDDWVNVFANVTAHEIGHMLGFGHIEREVFTESEAGRGLYVELMLTGHTMSELRTEQRFLLDQTNCPADGFVAKAVADTPILVCGAVR